MNPDDPICATIDRWRRHLRGDDPGSFEELLHEDCVFWSPVLHRPQRGRELTALYLNAAYQVFPGDGPAPAGTADEEADPAAPGDTVEGAGTGAFRYTKQVLDGHTAVLEFETRFGDIEVNGVDIITCDDDGAIVEFKVMLRPQRAVETARERMSAMLASMTGD